MNRPGDIGLPPPAPGAARIQRSASAVGPTGGGGHQPGSARLHRSTSAVSASGRQSPRVGVRVHRSPSTSSRASATGQSRGYPPLGRTISGTSGSSGVGGMAMGVSGLNRNFSAESSTSSPMEFGRVIVLSSCLGTLAAIFLLVGIILAFVLRTVTIIPGVVLLVIGFCLVIVVIALCCHHSRTEGKG